MPRQNDGRGSLASMVLTYKAVKDYKAGESIRQIAKKYDVSYTKARSTLLNAGVQLKRTGRYRADK